MDADGGRSPSCMALSPVGTPVFNPRASDRQYARSVERKGVDHGGGHVPVPKQFLHGANVCLCLQQARGKAVPQAVSIRWFGQVRRPAGRLDRILQVLLTYVVTTLRSAAGVDRDRRRPATGFRVGHAKFCAGDFSRFSNGIQPLPKPPRPTRHDRGATPRQTRKRPSPPRRARSRRRTRPTS